MTERGKPFGPAPGAATSGRPRATLALSASADPIAPSAEHRPCGEERRS